MIRLVILRFSFSFCCLLNLSFRFPNFEIFVPSNTFLQLTSFPLLDHKLSFVLHLPTSIFLWFI